MDLKTAREISARIWCDPEMSALPMNVELCEAIAHIILETAQQGVQRTANPGGLDDTEMQEGEKDKMVLEGFHAKQR